MDGREYARLVSKDRCKKRQTIEDTLELVGPYPELAVLLKRVLASVPIPKPSEHRGGPESDWFDVAAVLSHKEIDEIAEFLFDAEVAAVPLDGGESKEASRIAALSDQWNQATWEE